MTKSLLPGHRPPIEKAIDLAAADAFDGQRAVAGQPEGITIKDIDINPETCTFKVLQILSYSYNVDISGLNLPQARRLVAKAFLLNKHKGTRYAVSEVLNALYPNSSLEELEDEPFMFRITLCLQEDDILDSSVYSTIVRVVGATKNARSHLKEVSALVDMKASLKFYQGLKYEMEIEQELEIAANYDNTVTSYILFKI